MPTEGMSLSPLEVTAMQCLLQRALGMRGPSGPAVHPRAVGVGILPEFIVSFVASHLEFSPDELSNFREKFLVLLGTESKPMGMELTAVDVDAVSLAATVVHGIPAEPAYADLLKHGDVDGIASVCLQQASDRSMQHVVDDDQRDAWARKVRQVLVHMRASAVGAEVEAVA